MISEVRDINTNVFDLLCFSSYNRMEYNYRKDKKIMSNTKVITIYNQKGGVGKTTITINLAETLGRDFHKKVLIIDNDAQCSLSFLANLAIKNNGKAEDEDGQATLGYLEQLYQWHGIIPDYSDFEEAIIRPKYLKSVQKGFNWSDEEYEFHFDLLPSVGKDLSLAEIIYAAPSNEPFIVQPQNRPKGTAILRFLVQSIKEYYDYDYIFIDCPPSLGILSIGALLASDSLIIPTTTDMLSTIGIDTIINNLNDLGQVLPDFKVRGILFNSYTDTKFDNEAVADIEAYALENDIPIFKTKIPRTLQLKKLSSTDEIAVQQNSKEWTEYRQAMNSFAKEIVEQDEREGAY